jgi:hypothetical protein
VAWWLGYPDHHSVCYNTQLPSISDFYNTGYLSQQDHDWLPDDGIFKVPKHVGECRVSIHWRVTALVGFVIHLKKMHGGPKWKKLFMYCFSRNWSHDTVTLRRATRWLQLTATSSPCIVFHTAPRATARRHRGRWYSCNMVCCPVLWTGSSWDQERDSVRLNSDSVFLNSCQKHELHSFFSIVNDNNFQLVFTSWMGGKILSFSS